MFSVKVSIKLVNLVQFNNSIKIICVYLKYLLILTLVRGEGSINYSQQVRVFKFPAQKFKSSTVIQHKVREIRQVQQHNRRK